MNLKQLEAFVLVAEGKSFSGAAKEMYLTQPTVSAHIAALERELSTKLFVRNTKEVRLSEEGKTLLGYAKQMVQLEKQIEEIFSHSEEDRKHCITIAASTIPSQYLLPGILKSFSKKYPQEQFKIMQMDSAQVVEQVANHSVDIGFTGTVLEKKYCRYIPFYQDELVIITANNEKFARMQQLENDYSWVCKEPSIMREEGSGTRKEVEKQLKKVGVQPQTLSIVASMENQETIKKSVRNGVGISFISRLAVEEEEKDKKVLVFPFPKENGGRNINIVYNREFQLTRVAERFVKVVKEMYGMMGKRRL